MLLDDLLGIRDPLTSCLPSIRRPDAATGAVVDAAAWRGSTPAVYVIEDAHWIDEASESMLVEFIVRGRRTYALVLMTYRPEYRGALAASRFQTIPLRRLMVRRSALTADCWGRPVGRRAGRAIAERAAGNPFFARRSCATWPNAGCSRATAAATCAATTPQNQRARDLQAAIAARVDRLGAAQAR